MLFHENTYVEMGLNSDEKASSSQNWNPNGYQLLQKSSETYEQKYIK